MDFQLVLILLLSVITVNLVVVGFYIIVTLKDFRQTLSKMDSVMDDTSSIIHGIANPLTLISGLVATLSKAISSTRSAITSLRDER
jgi:uncharacterized protein YoxC